MINELNTQSKDFNDRLKTLLAFDMSENKSITETVEAILKDVKENGDKAVLTYTNKFDRLNAKSLNDLKISTEECQKALASLSKERREALEKAAARIRTYHEHQKKALGGDGYSYNDEYGTSLGQKITPIDRVGIYVPGGKAAYPSSVLMNAMPAHVAGVKDIVMVVPTPGGTKNELVLAAAYLAGVNQIFAIGGAQAVAALAYGTESILPVDKIVGPGNAYVAAAKRQVFGTVGIDMIAGPSEILVVADGTTPAKWVAMDLFSQAEHDEMAQSILLCPNQAYLDEVKAEMAKMLPQMTRRAILEVSLAKRAALIKTKDMKEACDIANIIAPEHLEVSAENPRQYLEWIRHAGAIFLGRFTSESLGDYCAGPNHVLPTSRTARFSSPLGVYDFQKRSSVIEVSEKGATILGQIACELANGEGLEAHAKSAAFRLEK